MTAMIVVIVSEISSKKPTDKIRPNENSRVRINVKTALRGLAFTSQITFNAFCNSTNTPVAPRSTVISPTMVASTDLFVWLMLMIMF